MTEVRKYKIGEFLFVIEKPYGMPSPKNLSLFLYEGEEEAAIRYRMKEISFEKSIIEQVHRGRRETPSKESLTEGLVNHFNPEKMIRREDRMILLKGDLEARLLFFHGAVDPYGIYLEKSETEVEIFVDRSVHELLVYDTIFLSLIGLEKQMINKDALILHCAYICRDGNAVLFSAPSGTGKSTQANLWEQHRKTRTINGDKALLYKHGDGKWYAHGWPICGSSEICYNETSRITAIVMLHQAKENAIRPLSVLEAIKKLMAQITINMWNPGFQLKAMDLIEELVKEVPIYELGCNISEDAVACLEGVL